MKLPWGARLPQGVMTTSLFSFMIYCSRHAKGVSKSNQFHRQGTTSRAPIEKAGAIFGTAGTCLFTCSNMDCNIYSKMILIPVVMESDSKRITLGAKNCCFHKFYFHQHALLTFVHIVCRAVITQSRLSLTMYIVV